MSPEIVYVALGSNLGDRAGYLAAGRSALAALPDTELVAASEIEETSPLGPPDQPWYLNQMVALRTTLEPSVLLGRLHEIERANGRVRDVRWGPRTLDLDIVRFGDRRVDQPGLVVPHPELPQRTFWQREAEQIETQIASGTR
jgi:2-amino-4-hydroxy-6-hydroxymethyldihydropteridine diphosphokinase